MDGLLIKNVTTYSAAYYGTYLYYSDSGTLDEVTAFSNAVTGILVSYSNNLTIGNCTTYSNSQQGIYLYYSNRNNLSNHVSYNNGQYAIYLYQSSYNNISRVNLSHTGANYGGIIFNAAHYNTLEDFNISGFGQSGDLGIYIYASDYNNISNG